MYQGAYALATFAAAALSVPVARRRLQYRPVAAFLVGMCFADHVRAQLIVRLIRPAKAAFVSRGVDPCRVQLPAAVVWAGHVEHALYLAFTAGVAALATWFYLRRAPSIEGMSAHPYRSPPASSAPADVGVALPLLVACLGWALPVAILVLGYDHLRCDAAQAVYKPAVVGSLVVSLGSIVQWRWRRVSPQIEHVAVALLFALEVCAAVTLSGLLRDLWPLAQIARVVSHTGLVVVQLLALLRGGRTWLGGGSRVD